MTKLTVQCCLQKNRSTFNYSDFEYSRYSFLSSYIGRDRADADELDLIIQYRLRKLMMIYGISCMQDGKMVR